MFHVPYSTVAAAAELALVEDLSIYSALAPLTAAQAEAALLNHSLWEALEVRAAGLAPASEISAAMRNAA